ncbi:MAG: hypothetical protein WD669_03925 [Pirellulales bacterium]
MAELDVNDPRSITHRVTVQMIQTAMSDGSSPATVFGSASQRASIEAGVDTIWAQAGIDVYFLPTINRWNNTFAYQGNAADFDEQGRRPSGNLGSILSTGDAAGVTNPTASVINEFFVKIVPGFALLGNNSAAGIANIGRDGTAQYVGSGLLTFQSGRDVIASVVGHEIGHVLGLGHVGNGLPNLMSPQGTTEQLTSDQISSVFNTSFTQLLPPPLEGDYNGDRVVNAADYTIWRNTLGSRDNLAADGNHNLVVDMGDFNVWKANFGDTPSTGTTAVISQSVPEPSLIVYLFGAAAILYLTAFRRFSATSVGSLA